MRVAGKSFGPHSRFLIYGPFYQPNSNGIRVLYTLAELLRKMKLDAQVICNDHEVQEMSKLPERYRPFFRRHGLDFSAKDVGRNDIVVYSDVISDNPLSAQNVVRYLLNRPFVLTGEAISYGSRDLVVSYSAWVDRHAFRLFLMNDDRHLFYPCDMSEKQDLALVYFGKNPHTRFPAKAKEFLKLFKKVEVITRFAPANRLELGNLLRKGRVLVSLDPLTSLCHEATLCSTPVLIPSDDFNVIREKGELTPWGVFSDPIWYSEAVGEVKKAYPLYEAKLRDNPNAVREFVKICFDHFNSCKAADTAFRYGGDLLKQNLSVRKELDELRFRVLHNQKTITGIQSNGAPKAKDHAIAQFFVDTGHGFSERDSITSVVTSLGRQRLRFDTSRYDEALRVRLDPADDAVHCRLESLVAIRNDGTKVDLVKNVRANSALVLGADFFFSTKDPQFVIGRELDRFTAEIEAEIDYVALGDAVIGSLCKMIKSVDCHDAQLFFDTGRGFNETDSLSLTVSSAGRHVLEYDLSNTSSVNGLRFDPSARPVGIKVLSFVAIDRSGARIELTKSLSGNYASRDAHSYLFNADDPQLLVGQKLNHRLSRVVVEIEYHREAADRLPHTLARNTKSSTAFEKSTSDIRKEIRALVGKYQAARRCEETARAPTTSEVGFAARPYNGGELSDLVDSTLEIGTSSTKSSEEFESRLAEYVGVDGSILVHSGSSANLLAVSALTSSLLRDRRLLPGDEIITTAAAFPTTLNPIIQNLAVPVFVDVQLGTYVPTVESIEAAITTRTKAMILAHTMGVPFPVSEVAELCRQKKIWLIEDNCDALGSRYLGQLTGSFGDFATLSFQPTDHLSIGGWGSVVTNNEDLARVARSIRDGGRNHDREHVSNHLGNELKATDMQAALGMAKLDALESFVDARKRNHALFTRSLQMYNDWLVIHRAPVDGDPAWCGFVVTLRPTTKFSRREIVAHLESNKIEVKTLFCGNLLRHPAYSKIKHRVAEPLKNSDLITSNSFVFDVSPGLTEEIVQYTTSMIDRFFRDRA